MMTTGDDNNALRPGDVWPGAAHYKAALERIASHEECSVRLYEIAADALCWARKIRASEFAPCSGDAQPLPTDVEAATRFLLDCGAAPFSAPLEYVHKLAGLLAGRRSEAARLEDLIHEAERWRALADEYKAKLSAERLESRTAEARPEPGLLEASWLANLDVAAMAADWRIVDSVRDEMRSRWDRRESAQSAKEVAGSTPAGTSTVAGMRFPEGDRGVVPSRTSAQAGRSQPEESPLISTPNATRERDQSAPAASADRAGRGERPVEGVHVPEPAGPHDEARAATSAETPHFSAPDASPVPQFLVGDQVRVGTEAVWECIDSSPRHCILRSPVTGDEGTFSQKDIGLSLVSRKATPNARAACGCVCVDCLRAGLATHQVCSWACSLKTRAATPTPSVDADVEDLIASKVKYGTPLKEAIEEAHAWRAGQPVPCGETFVPVGGKQWERCAIPRPCPIHVRPKEVLSHFESCPYPGGGLCTCATPSSSEADVNIPFVRAQLEKARDAIRKGLISSYADGYIVNALDALPKETQKGGKT